MGLGGGGALKKVCLYSPLPLRGRGGRGGWGQRGHSLWPLRKLSPTPPTPPPQGGGANRILRGGGAQPPA